jgi:hypothetical protein
MVGFFVLGDMYYWMNVLESVASMTHARVDLESPPAAFKTYMLGSDQ